MQIEHYINGIKLETQDCHIQSGGTFLGGLSTRRSATDVAGRHGTIASVNPPLYEEREYTLQMIAFGENAAAEASRVARLCSLPHITLGRSVNGVMQECTAELASLSEGNVDLPHAIPLTATFALPSVWWRSPDWMLQHPDADGLLDCGTSDAPIVDVQIRLPRGCAAVVIADTASNTGISWSGSADESQYTYISAETLTAWRSNEPDAWDSAGTTVTGVDYPPAGPLALYPQADEKYRISCETPGETDPVVFRLKQAWW